MNSLSRYVKYVIAVLFLISIQSSVNAQSFNKEGRCQSMDFNWRFHLGDAPGADNPQYNDSGWRELNVPHDWGVEGKFSPDNASCTAYLPAGTGWYRKEFTLPEQDKDKQIEIQFDGVYDNSKVWINGHYLGNRPYGFISFCYDLTPYLHFGGAKNVIAVQVNHSHVADSRWYTGSGIYRNVWLYVTNKIHVAHWGTYVTTPSVSDNSAEVKIITSIVNKTEKDHNIKLVSLVVNAESKVVGKTSSVMPFQKDTKYDFGQSINVKEPVLWTLENPYMYSLISEVYAGDKLEDRDSTAFGIRTIKFDADKGFLLNGKSTKLKGVCLHNDAGSVGAAVPEREWERRLKLMKEMGANAIRTSHNPPAIEFLNLCDRMGFLVMDEAFDEWAIGKKKWMKGWNVGNDEGAAALGTYYSQNGYSDFFQKWSKKDLQDMIKRDRNHPSVILWSIGNEIDYPNDPYTDPYIKSYEPWRASAYQITAIARRLYDDVKEMDTTRPVTAALANIPLSDKTGYAALLDVVGYNYQEKYYKEDHEKYPGRKITGSENSDSYEAWLAVKDNQYIPGQFLWTGVDYLGEAGQFPVRSNISGLVDLSDFKKTGYYFRQSLWTEKQMVHITCISPEKANNKFGFRMIDGWNWDNYKGQEVTVLAFTNCDSVELYLNGRSLGMRNLKDAKNAVLSWKVPYESGELKAVAYSNGKKAAENILKTTGKAEKILLESDLSTIHADGEDFANVKILVTDADGNIVPDAGNEITVKVSGAGKNIGFGNGDNTNIESYKSDTHQVFEGKARVYIQSDGKKGNIKIEASGSGLKSAVINIKAG